MPAWAWAVLAVVGFLVVGLLAVVLVGAAGAPGDAARRLWQLTTFRRPVHHGVELPPETRELAGREQTGGDGEPHRR